MQNQDLLQLETPGLYALRDMLFKVASNVGMPLSDPAYYDYQSDCVSADVQESPVCLETCAVRVVDGRVKNPLDLSDGYSVSDMSDLMLQVTRSVSGLNFDTTPYALSLADSLVLFADVDDRSRLRGSNKDDGHLSDSIENICQDYSRILEFRLIPSRMKVVQIIVMRNSPLPGLGACNWSEYQFHVLDKLFRMPGPEVLDSMGEFYQRFYYLLEEYDLIRDMMQIVVSVLLMKQPRIQTQGAIKKKLSVDSAKASYLAYFHKSLPFGCFNHNKLSRRLKDVKKYR